MPYGNLLIAAGIMFSGASPVKVINAMKFSGVHYFSRKTFFSIQSAYLVPSVDSVYKRLQSELISEIVSAEEEVHAGGDARCCSPGHTAQFSSYSIMDLTRNKILDVQLVQSNEVKNSYAMELEGLKRCLAFLAEKDVNVTDLVTDRHSQVKKYMRESTTIRHWFDVWHVAKGFKSYMELEKVVKGRLLVTDVKRLSPAEQTSSLESYHKIVCQFAPKFVHYEFPQMQARIQLSALHFNANANRAQAVTKAGEPQYRISYPKARKGQPVAAEVKVGQTFRYIDVLMEDVLAQRGMFNSYRKAKQAKSLRPETPLPIARSTPYRKQKSEVVAERVERFNR